MMTSREKFEAWAKRRGMTVRSRLLDDGTKQYVESYTQHMWESWSAARPDGYALVPTVPTDDMIVAFAEQWYSARQTIDDPQMNEAYAAMLAVAPQPGDQ